MIAVNYTNLRDNLKSYCDKVNDDFETVVVTRKDNLFQLHNNYFNICFHIYSHLNYIFSPLFYILILIFSNFY